MIKNSIISILIITVILSCKGPGSEVQSSDNHTLPAINSQHLDHLTQPVTVEGKEVLIVHIYSEYPDYRYVGDDDEGIACVDDVARAAVFYLRHFKQTGDSAALQKAKGLYDFILVMQSDSGYFYNFIWEDGSIHKAGPTTRAEPNWWSWRALWAFGEAMEIMGPNDAYLNACSRLVEQVISNPVSTGYSEHEGLKIPHILPDSSAADQGSILLMGLCSYYRFRPSEELLEYITSLASALGDMQVKSKGTMAHGAFLSWRNLWHAYGNLQAYALLKTRDVIEESDPIDQAKIEVDSFLHSIVRAGGKSHFYVRHTEDGTEVYNEAEFPQIAYNLRPMIWSTSELYTMTKNQKYLQQAMDLWQWFEGDNPANIKMYDPGSGRCYDGINNADTYNRNSGAESTIEALLSLQVLHEIKSKTNG